MNTVIGCLPVRVPTPPLDKFGATRGNLMGLRPALGLWMPYLYMTRPLGKCKLAEMLGFVGVVFVKGAGEYSFAIGC